MKAYILPGVAALVLLAYYVYRSMAEVEPAPEPATTPSAPASVPEPEPADAPTPEPAPTTAVAPEPAAPAEPAAQEPRPDRARARAERDALRERLTRAQRKRLRTPDQDPVEPDALGVLNKDYIQQRIKDDLLPLAVECYQMALEDDDQVQGRLVLEFRIVGEPDVGGLVEDVQMTQDSEITHADLIECMRESMMSVSFAPPEDGGTVVVHYPFVFEPEDP